MVGEATENALRSVAVKLDTITSDCLSASHHESCDHEESLESARTMTPNNAF
jgi:hypothetical protein